MQVYLVGSAVNEGKFYDPYKGMVDIENKVIRHVNEAFVDDPLRVLRVARFSARYNFAIAKETLELIKDMSFNGGLDSLPPARVWDELCKALMTDRPWRFFYVLREVNALEKVFPYIHALISVPQSLMHHPENCSFLHTMMVLQQAVKMNAPLEVRLACLFHDLGKATTHEDMLPRHIGHETRSAKIIKDLDLPIPSKMRRFAVLVGAEHLSFHKAASLSGKALARLFYRCNGKDIRQFKMAIQACKADALGRAFMEDEVYTSEAVLLRVVEIYESINFSQLFKEAVERGLEGPKIGDYAKNVFIRALVKEFG